MGCCEQVLELLTADSTTPGEHERLAEHLCDCPSCRRLAEALSPAVELFREVLREDAEVQESADLPLTASPWDAAAPWDTDALPPRVWTGRSWMGGMGLAAAVMLGVMLGGIAQTSSNRLASGPSGADRATPVAQRVSIESLGLADSCWTVTPAAFHASSLVPPLEPQSPAHAPTPHPGRQPTLADLNCCTFCHAAGKPAVAKPAVGREARSNEKFLYARLQTSCQLCHASAQVSAPSSTTRVQ